MEKSRFWKICLWSGIGVLIICCFMPAFVFDMGMFGRYSLSFYDVAFSDLGDAATFLLILVPIIMLITSVLQISWKYKSAVIGAADLVALLFLLFYPFQLGGNAGAAFFLYFIDLICIDAFVVRINDEEKKNYGESGGQIQKVYYSGSVCTNCGAPLKNGAKFCEKCGQPVNLQQTSQIVEPQLSQPIVSETKHEMKEPQANNECEAQTVDLSQGPTDVKPEQMGTVCPHCGAVIPKDVKFCPHCGKQIDQKKCCPNCNAEIKDGDLFCEQCGYKLTD